MLPTLVSLALLSACHVLAAPLDELFDRQYNPSQHVRRQSGGNATTGRPRDASGYNGAVATEVAECSDIGISILSMGGNAADAIIAAGLCVGTIAAYHSGIGGGGFLLSRYNNKDGTHGYEEIDFRETMPAAGNLTMYSALGPTQTASTIGGLAVGVPGELRAWQMLYERHGSLPWKTLFQPAINLARNGFNINVDLAAAIAGYNVTLANPLFAESYAPNGTRLVQGQTCYRKRYADTLERIANEGVGIFYANSSIANNTINTIRNSGGIMTAADLANYTAIVRTPVNITYRNQRIFSTVAPSSGAVVLSALKVFEGFDGSAQDNDPAINLTLHRLVQANEFAYGQRTTFGDPAFTPNVTMLERLYLQNATVDAIRAKISSTQTFNLSYYMPNPNILTTATREAGTSHMAVIDKNGGSVSLTTTVNLFWGSQLMTPDGFILNNEMDDFSSPGQVNSFGFAASPINFIAGGKRPQSSIASSIAEDLVTGDVTIATGSAGGSRIITTTIQELYHHIDQGLNATQCVYSPRWHDQLSGLTYFELPNASLNLTGFSNGTVGFFRGLGYNVTYQNPTAGSTSHVVIRFRDGLLEAASDPRKSAGYGAAY